MLSAELGQMIKLNLFAFTRLKVQIELKTEEETFDGFTQFSSLGYLFIMGILTELDLTIAPCTHCGFLAQ